MPIMVAKPRSASSRTMVADLPPSSRKVRFMVAAPFSMMRCPTAVEPVNEIMSTLGDRVSSSPIMWSDDVTMLTTPGGMSVCSAMRRPRRVAFHGVSGAGFSDHRVAGGQRLAQLVRGHLEREVPRDDGAHDADGLPPDPPGVERALEAGGVGQHRLPLELVDQLGRVGQRVGERRVELRAVRRHARAADLEDQLLAQLLLLGLQRRRAAAGGTACGRRGWSTSRSRRRPGGPRRSPAASRRSRRRPPGR